MRDRGILEPKMSSLSIATGNNYTIVFNVRIFDTINVLLITFDNFAFCLLFDCFSIKPKESSMGRTGGFLGRSGTLRSLGLPMTAG